MAKMLWVLCAVSVISVNCAHAVEGNTKKSAISIPMSKPAKEPVPVIEMVSVKGGCYKMGDAFGEGGPEEKPVHEVCVDDFSLGKYEVTQGQWNKIMGKNPSINSSCGDTCPVENVSWKDVQEFISKLNSRSGDAKKPSGKYRLPTEA